MSQQHPLILVVDENDKPVGAATKKEVQEKGLLHRIVHVMVEDSGGRILLQKRAEESELHPGWWDPAVGGHVDEGEDYLTAAKREMFEEIGLEDIEPQELGKYQKSSKFEWRHLNRFYKVFKVVVDADANFNPEPTEVAELRWFTLEEARQLIETSDQVTQPLIEALNRYYL